MAESNQVLEHLLRDYDQPVRDPVWHHILLSRPMIELMGVRAFQKLHGIKQLGPAHLVYPGATHTRLNHSLGVFHIARRMMVHMATRAGLGAAGLSLEGVKAFLCAALLHDLGHYPFAHSLKDLDIRPHEDLTAEAVLQEELRSVLREKVGTDPALVAAIIDHALPYDGSEEVAFYRNLLSGVLDPDKLDYLNRDAYFCGIPYGIQDVDFVLEEIFPHDSRGLAVTRKGLTAVESILFSKYLMYRAVYWHKTVRIATAMIKKAVLMGLADGVLRPESLYRLNDAEFYALTASVRYPPFRLIDEAADRRLYKLVFQTPYRPEDPAHRRLAELDQRRRIEEELARQAGRAIGRRVAPEEVVIDLPEPISFEIDLPVLDPSSGTLVPFRESESVFSAEVVEGFTRSLRRVSLICNRDERLIEALRDLGAEHVPGGGL